MFCIFTLNYSFYVITRAVVNTGGISYFKVGGHVYGPYRLENRGSEAPRYCAEWAVSLPDMAWVSGGGAAATGSKLSNNGREGAR